MTTLEDIRQAIRPIAKERQLEKVIAFGSYARGEATPASDIDLVIDTGGLQQSFEVFCTIGKLLEALPIRADIFEISEIKRPSATYFSMMNEGVVIYER